MKGINKYILIVFVVFFGSFTTHAQSSDLLTLLDKIEDGEGITSVLVTKKMFELFAKTTNIEVEGESLNEVIGGLKELKIFDIDQSTASKSNQLNFSEIKKILARDGYEILLKIKEQNENVEIYILDQNDIVKHLFLIAQGDGEMQLISLVGDIELEKIAKLSGTLNIDELNYLNDK